ncbi:hypothetical protein DFH28DRAFT_1129892 [Melampsora americana]|nr:hypothetical protein DFH28DRAFT_1129892 [Melampsora americana]
MSSPCSINNKVSTDLPGLLSPFVYQAPSVEPSRHQRPSNFKVERSATNVQYPFPSATKVLSYSTPICYHLPPRLREQPEISCFKSDDEDHKERLGVKKALAVATDALVRWTRRRANSSSSPRALRHAHKEVRAPVVTGTTKSKTQSQNQQVVEHSWELGSDAKSTLHKVQWSGSTLSSVTKPYISSVPICRESRQATTAYDFDSGLEKNMKGDSISKWIGWYGSNPFEIEDVQKLRRSRIIRSGMQKGLR